MFYRNRFESDRVVMAFKVGRDAIPDWAKAEEFRIVQSGYACHQPSGDIIAARGEWMVYLIPRGKDELPRFDAMKDEDFAIGYYADDQIGEFRVENLIINAGDPMFRIKRTNGSGQVTTFLISNPGAMNAGGTFPVKWFKTEGEEPVEATLGIEPIPVRPDPLRVEIERHKRIALTHGLIFHPESSLAIDIANGPSRKRRKREFYQR